jgi:nucleoid-associated protein YgaU
MRKTKKALRKAQANLPPQKLIASHKKEFVAGVLGFLGILGLLIYLVLSVQQRPLLIPNPSLKQPLTPSVTPDKNKYYILKDGESLWEVAEKEYGNPYLYPTIIELNRLANPDFTNPGTKIRVR